MRFERPTIRKLVAGLLLVGLYLVSALAGFFYFTLSRIVVEEPLMPVPESREVSAFDLSPLPTPEPQPGINILLLGYGGAGHEGGNLSDSQVVVHIDPDKKQVVFISVPRDLWVPLPVEGGTRNRKINHAYASGGGGLAKQVVGAVVGIPIEHFVSVSFDGFKEAIDILDGVEVDVPVAFDDYYFPVPGKEIEACGKSPEEVEEILTTLKGFEIDKQFPCRFETIHFDKGKQLMDGEKALKFVRSRHSAQHGGDFARSERTAALLMGVKGTLLSLDALDDAIPFFNQLSHTIQTDIDEGVIKYVIEAIGDEQEYAYSALQLSVDNVLVLATSSDGQSILIPKAGVGEWKKIHEYVRDQIEISKNKQN